MIDFTFPPEVEDVRMRVRRFMDETVRPRWESIDQDDRKQVVKAIVELRGKARNEEKLWLPHMPAEWGGMGLGPTAMAAVSAEAAKVGIGPFVLNARRPTKATSTRCCIGQRPSRRRSTSARCARAPRARALR